MVTWYMEMLVHSFYLTAIPKVVKNLVTSIVHIMFTIVAPPDKQGIIQCIGEFIARIGLAISLTALPAIYAATVTTFPEAVFIVVVILIFILLILDMLLLVYMKRIERQTMEAGGNYKANQRME
ncbi:unnamed protein product [Heterobilharzia americana]|nr:unnamed protein product [Heterobilharzia americana]